MKDKVNKIGIITYKKYEERVIIDNNFNTEELYTIMNSDPDFVSFKIEGESFSSSGERTVSKDVQITGTTYNAYADQPLTHKTKTTWKVTGGAYFKTKKEADQYAQRMNNSERTYLNSLV